MKKFLLGTVGLLFAFLMSAQVNTVTINLQGNREREIRVNGTLYDPGAVNATGVTAPIVISNLPLGQHSLEVITVRGNGSNNTSATTPFKLRTGYDLQIIVRNNGAVQLKEVKSKNVASGHPGLNKTPMSSTTYNKLLQNVKRQSKATTRLTLVNSAVKTTANYFTSSQLELLISQISSQTNRISVLKSAYLKVTDPQNYTSLYNSLLTTQANRDLIAAHINTYNYYNTGNTNTNTGNTHNQGRSAMSDYTFSTLLQSAGNRTGTSRSNYILDAFSNTNNYYTTSQAIQLIQLVPEEHNRLILAKTAYRGIVDPSGFSAMENLFDSYTNRKSLSDYVGSYSGGTVYNYRTPMTDATFKSTYDQISSAWGIGAKYNALTSLFSNTTNYVTAAQARQLIGMVSEDENRLTLAKAAYANITDPTNYRLLHDLLSSQSRYTLDTYVTAYNNGTSTGTVVRTAMTDSDFTTLYRNVSNTWGFGAKMNSLSTIFANTSYYFTTDQAKRLIELVSSEDNRLTLAKAAHKQIVDLENFKQLATILSSQSSKDELEAYARQ